MVSPSSRHALTSKKSTSSDFERTRLTARPKPATGTPSLVNRSSGSRVRLPASTTLLNETMRFAPFLGVLPHRLRAGTEVFPARRLPSEARRRSPHPEGGPPRPRRCAMDPKATLGRGGAPFLRLRPASRIKAPPRATRSGHALRHRLDLLLRSGLGEEVGRREGPLVGGGVAEPPRGEPLELAAFELLRASEAPPLVGLAVGPDGRGVRPRADYPAPRVADETVQRAAVSRLVERLGGRDENLVGLPGADPPDLARLGQRPQR